MADGSDRNPTLTRWDQAYEAVDQWLASIAFGVRRLGVNAATLYPARKARDGWRLEVQFDATLRRLDVLVTALFPFEPPRIMLVDRPPHLTWPHLEADGYLCLLPPGTPTTAVDPVALVKYLFAEAATLIERSERGDNEDDFRTEFLSYWPADDLAPKVRSLLLPQGPSRTIAVYRTQSIYFAGENGEALTRFLEHAFLRKAGLQSDFDTAFLIWLEQPMLPRDYPRQPSDVIVRIRDAGFGDELDRLAAARLDEVLVLFGAPSANGPAFAAVVLLPTVPRAGKKGRTPRGGIERGFRPGMAPPAVRAARSLGSMRKAQAAVERIDHNWIHGRDSDPDQPRLSEAKVVIVGCGSLGSPVALGLAQAGVGSLDLVDPEILTAANVGRHVLGTSEIAFGKARALQARISSSYPQIRHIESFRAGWEDVAAKAPERLRSADLIISTIGDWGPEAALNAWRQDQAHPPNLLFGWTEPHAVAGHAIGLVCGTGCLACGLSPHGEPLLPVAAWPNGAGQQGEPACGVVYQPYGPIEIQHITALIAESAIDIVLRRTESPFHRIWIARQSLLERAGGVWSDAWIEATRGSPRGACVEELPWAQSDSCPICARVAA